MCCVCALLLFVCLCVYVYVCVCVHVCKCPACPALSPSPTHNAQPHSRATPACNLPPHNRPCACWPLCLQARWVLLGGRILMHGGVQGPLGSAKVSRRTHTLDLVRRQVAWLDISSKPPYYESGIQVCV